MTNRGSLAPPPYKSLEDCFRDRPRKIARGARKATGLPATSDVSEPARLIVALRYSVESHLGRQRIAGAAVTIPLLAALYQENLEDAFEYAGLLYIPHYPYWYGGVFHETGAVYVGNGFGLCSNYTDPVGCDLERKNPPHQPTNQNFVSVSYTRGLLTSTWATEGMWFSYPASEGPGWDKRKDNRNNYNSNAPVSPSLPPPLQNNKRDPTRIFQICWETPL